MTPGISKPKRVLRAIAHAVASAQQEIDAHQRERMFAQPPLRSYRIAHLALEYTKARGAKRRGPPRSLLFRVTRSEGDGDLLAELVIDGRTEETLVVGNTTAK